MTEPNWILTTLNEIDFALSVQSHEGTLGVGPQGDIALGIFITSEAERSAAEIVALGIESLNASETLKDLALSSGLTQVDINIS